MRDSSLWLFLTLLVVCVLVVAGLLLGEQQRRECAARGGVLVKGYNGLPTCVAQPRSYEP